MHTRLYKLLAVYNATRITRKARNGNYIFMGNMVERTYVTAKPCYLYLYML
jgi:hypothetical protein